MTTWNDFTEWVYSFGAQYGVDPFVFALLYFGTIPISLWSFAYLVKNFRAGKSIFFPVLGMSLSFIGTYIYLFWVGRNIPWWVWMIVIAVMCYSLFRIYFKIKKFVKPFVKEPEI